MMKRDTKRFLVIGIGRFGRALCEALAEVRAVEVIAIDERMEAIETVRDKVGVAAQVDSIDREALEALGAREIDVAVVSIGEDFEAAVLTVAVLKELGIREIIARAHSERRQRILQAVGATRVVTVESEMGRRLARTLVATHVLDHLEIGEGISIIQWEADERVIGQRLRALDLPHRHGLTLVAVKHCPMNQRMRVVQVPDPDYVFRQHDVLVLCGENERLTAFTG